MQSTELAYRARAEEVFEAGSPYSNFALIRSMQIKRGSEACFLTDQRLLCQDRQCEWRRECCRLVAVWRR
ncbi:MAG: hypothetical protein HW386_1232 [Gammaproteobacteria bacterium]|nr:hypothetical protein [Gammaproteobacteria bacterium]